MTVVDQLEPLLLDEQREEGVSTDAGGGERVDKKVLFRAEHVID